MRRFNKILSVSLIIAFFCFVLMTSTAEASDSNDTQPPSTPTGLAAANITETSVALSWNASTDNNGIKEYDIYRDGVQIAATQNLTLTNTWLTPGQNYSYTVKAVDLSGNASGMSGALQVTTLSDTQPPTAPTGIRLISKTDTSITIGWNASTDNTRISGYEVYRDGVKRGSTPGLTITNTTLAPGKSYTFTLKAYDAAGNLSDASVPFTESTLPDTQPPTAPTGLISPSATETSINLAWTISTDNVSVTGYEIYRDGVKVGSTPGNTCTSTSLKAGKSYTFTIKAYDAAGNLSDASAPVIASTLPDTQPPLAPTGLTAVNVTETSVTLGWNASADNDGIKEYDIYRDGAEITATQNLTLTNTWLTPGQNYSYTVKAVDWGGNESGMSEALQVKTLSDTQPPTAPTGIRIISKTDTSITIGWDASTDNTRVSGYEVYRDGIKRGSTPGLTITNTTLAPGKSYTFTVKAYDAAGNLSDASTVEAATEPSADANLSGLALSAGTINPEFSSNTFAYSVNDIGYDVSSIAVTPTVEDSGATVTVNGTAVASGQASQPINLNVGDNTITVQVNAADGTQQTYTVVVTRAQATPAYLSNILFGGNASFQSAFVSTQPTAGVNVLFDPPDTFTLTPQAVDAGATITINGTTTINSGDTWTAPSPAAGLTNTIILKVSAPGKSDFTYTLTILRATTPYLAATGGIVVGGYMGAKYKETYSPTGYNYTITNRPGTTSHMTVKATAADTTANFMVTISTSSGFSQSVTSGTVVNVPVNTTGGTTITITVNSRIGVDHRNYVITVN